MISRTINAALAAALAIVSAFGLVVVLDAMRRGDIGSVPFVGRMLSQPDPFLPAVPFALAPAAILAVLALVLVQLVLRLLKVRSEHAAARAFQVWVTGGGGAVPGNLSSPNNRAGRRAGLVGDARKAAGDISETLGGAASVDAQRLHGSYAWLHAFAWSLPVIGFVGTAVGMASSITGFSAALRNTTQVNDVVARLSQEVIPGLASAFETTVLALMAALVTYFCSSALQHIDEEALQRLDDASLDLVARTRKSASEATLPALEEISRKLNGLGPLSKLSVLDQILSRLDKISTTPDRADQVVKALAEVVSDLKTGAAELKTAGTLVTNAAKGIEEATRELREAARAPYTVRIERG